MTSLTLLSWIGLAIALQLAIYLSIGSWRHWKSYKALRNSMEEMNLPGMQQVLHGTEELPAVAAWAGFRPFRVERKVIEDAEQSVCSFYLKTEDGQPLPAFSPGQFLTFRLEIHGADGDTEQITRCYSLSDAPRQDGYRISIKRAQPPAGSHFPAGRSSSYFHDQIVVGNLLQVRAPSGHFYIERSEAPVVLIGGGIGITPMLSMLNWSLAEQPGREIWLFYSVRNGRELVMRSHLEALAAAHPNFHLHFCFSKPLSNEIAGRDYHHRGRVDVNLLRMQLPLRPFHFYICGPGPLMESLVPALEEWGVSDAHIHFEAFGPASIKRKQAAMSQTSTTVDSDIVITFARSGKQLPWQPAIGSLLEFAESNGIAVDSSCRAGGCGCCQTTIHAGEVSYRQPPEFDPEPGNCLLCVSIPKTSVTLEA